MGVDESQRVHAANLEKVDHVVVMMPGNRWAGHPGTGRHPPNELQKSVLAATHELIRRGHPPNAP